MNKRDLSIQILFILSVSLLFISGCLTTGDRVNMQEYARQMEGGTLDSEGQTLEAQANTMEAASAVTTVAIAQAVETAVLAQVETPAPAPTESITEAPAAAVAEVKEFKEPEKKTAAVVPKAENTPVAAKPVEKEALKQDNGVLYGVLFFILGVGAILAVIFLMKKAKDAIKEEDESTENIQAAMPVAEPQAPPAAARTVPPEDGYTAGNIIFEKFEPDQKRQTITAPAPQADWPVPKPIEAQAQVTEPETEEAVPAGTVIIEGPRAAEPIPERPGEGKADITPVQVSSATPGNIIRIEYKVGEDSPEYRTIKITAPAGWSAPSTNPVDDGNFTVEVKDGSFISKSVEGMAMIIRVYNLKAATGEVIVNYGDMSRGGKGALAGPEKGMVSFKIETETGIGEQVREIEQSPVIEVI